MKKYIIGVVAVLLIGAGAAAYLVVDHNNDVAHAKAVKAARQARIERAYQRNLSAWRADDAAWQEKQNAYEDCKSGTSDAFDAGDEVAGIIASGGSREDFLDPEQTFSTEINRASRAIGGDFDCLHVLLNLSKAHDKVGDGLNIWLDWIRGDDYLDADSPDDLPIDSKWDKAQQNLADATSSLNDMEPGPEPVKPKRGETYESTPSGDDSGDISND
jgi:hypothetical protein